jgi:zinc protease
MRFAFQGGSAQDPADKAGLAYFVSGMMNEGAGSLDSAAFQNRIEELAVKFNFDAARDVMAGNVQTLTQNRDEAFELLRMALAEPHMAEDATERVRGQISATQRYDMNDPEHVATEEWYRMAFPGHPYSQAVKGSPETLAKITAADLKDYVRKTYARDNLKVAVVGDITAEELSTLLDKVFGGLPEKAELVPVADAEPPLGPEIKTIDMDIPQTVVRFGHRAVARKDKDFMAAYLLNYIIGGGGFNSRLMEEVREKRGLAYSVYSYIYPFQHASLFVGAVATQNEAVNTSIDVIQTELERIAKDGPTEEELTNAKAYQTGSYALRFDTSSKIANQLLWIQLEDLGVDYVDRRNSEVEAVTIEDIRRVAQELIEPDKLITTIVGRPTPAAAPAEMKSGG